MRVSIPAIVIVMCLVIGTLAKSIENKRRVIVIVLCGLLFLGATTPMKEINRSIRYTITAEQLGETPYMDSWNPTDEHWYDHYFGYLNRFFFRHLAR